MEISRKQKTEIMNEMRHQLSQQHKDSLEYLHGKIVGEKIEEKTQAVFDVLEKLPNYAVHNTIAEIRGDFRQIRRWVLDEVKHKDSMFDSIEQAMDFLYSHMMGITKIYLFNDEEMAKDFEDHMIKLAEAKVEEIAQEV